MIKKDIFIMAKRQGRTKGVYFTYELAQYVVRYYNIKSRQQYWQWWTDFKNPRAMPNRPEVQYEEWEGWGHFLGSNNTFGPRELIGPIRGYWEAMRWVHAHGKEVGAITKQSWRDAWDADKIPSDIPKHPNIHYKEWKGWKQWLGKTTMSKVESAKLNLGVLALANVPSMPDNVFTVITTNDGINELEQMLISQQLRAFAVYDYHYDKKMDIEEVLNSTCTKSDNNLYITHNKYDLLYEFDQILDKRI